MQPDRAVGSEIPRPETGDEPDPAKPRKLLRQSTLLLLGRILSKLGNFATQILIVRYLSRTEYGGFAYALTVATVLQNIVGLGLDRSVVRFLPIYQEQRDWPRLFGTVVLALVVIIGLGLLTAGGLFIARDLVGTWVPNRDTTLPLLVIMVLLAPLQSLDDLLVGLFAVFAKARSIFLRRFLLAPLLRLAVAVVMIASGGDAVLLAWGYVGSSLLGLALYSALLFRELRREGVLDHWSARHLRLPWREVLGFTLPLLTTDLTYAAMTALSVILLGRVGGTAGVASLTAVQPAARMNELVMNTFGILYVPLASRMFAKHDRSGINALYWRTAIWIAILSFPVFVATFSLARPLTVLLFGSRYASSASVLAILAVGHYFNAALGHNGLTLKVFGNVRALVVINVATIAASVVLSALLIPSLGALGAAIAISSALLIHNVLKQVGLKIVTGVRLFDPRYVPVYAGIAVCAVGLQLMTAALSPPIPVIVIVAIAATWLLVRWNARVLELGETFPEVRRWPGLALFLPRNREAAG